MWVGRAAHSGWTGSAGASPSGPGLSDNRAMSSLARTQIPIPSGLVGAHLRRLVMLRWISVGAMLLAALALPRVLGLVVWIGPLLAAAFALAAANLFALAWLRLRPEPRPVVLFVHLLIDVLGWSVFLYFAGGASNPLISMLLPVVAIGAAVLPGAQAWVLAALAMGSYSLLWRFSHPIRLEDAAMGAHWHLSGMWLTFVVSACLITAFVVRMTAALRARDRDLADAREARARDERIVALGNLAAGAAHSLGTPLGTLRILVDELARGENVDAETRSDLDLMREQIEHCKQTLAALTARAGNLRAEGGRPVAADAWLRSVVGDWQVQRPHVHAILDVDPALEAVTIVADDTLAQTLHTLVNNAADASPDEVGIGAGLADGWLRIEVLDRGPGIPADLRETLGSAPVEDRPAGMGIGLFLARAALNRHDGRLSFLPRSGGGTIARIELPLERITP